MSDLISHTSCDDACSDRRGFLRDAIHMAVALASIASVAPLRALDALSVDTSGAIRYPIPATDSVAIDKKNDVILCRLNGEVYAFALSCPHQNTALRTLPKNTGFQCPRHKSKYQPNGTFISGKATRNMDRLNIARDNNEVVVDPDVAIASDTDAAKWAAAVVRL